MSRWLSWIGGLALLALVVGVVVLGLFLRRGVSAKAEPWAIETWVARELRHVAIPRADRERPNPIPRSEDVVAQGLAHFADHCAVCHANDGSGETMLGQGLYPPPPDLREAQTRDLSDGELFWIIRNGIRFTGMPGFAETPPEQDEESWHLVHFIRHLPEITRDELMRMDRLNPLTGEEAGQHSEAEHHHGGEAHETGAHP